MCLNPTETSITTLLPAHRRTRPPRASACHLITLEWLLPNRDGVWHAISARRLKPLRSSNRTTESQVLNTLEIIRKEFYY